MGDGSLGIGEKRWLHYNQTPTQLKEAVMLNRAVSLRTYAQSELVLMPDAVMTSVVWIESNMIESDGRFRREILGALEFSTLEEAVMDLAELISAA